MSGLVGEETGGHPREGEFQNFSGRIKSCPPLADPQS